MTPKDRLRGIENIVAAVPQVAVGDQFGRWTVAGAPFVLPIRAAKAARRQFVVCKCECGDLQVVKVENIRSGKSAGCGCVRPANGYKHGWCGTRLHRIWLSMNARCTYPSCEMWHRYGGRGIRVCDEWRDCFGPFRDWALANGYEDSLTIDRKDNDGDYCPDNCRWATQGQQANNKSSSVKVAAFGETKTAKEWSLDDRCVVPYRTLIRRFHTGIDPELAITTRDKIPLR